MKDRFAGHGIGKRRCGLIAAVGITALVSLMLVTERSSENVRAKSVSVVPEGRQVRTDIRDARAIDFYSGEAGLAIARDRTIDLVSKSETTTLSHATSLPGVTAIKVIRTAATSLTVGDILTGHDDGSISVIGVTGERRDYSKLSKGDAIVSIDVHQHEIYAATAHGRVWKVVDPARPELLADLKTPVSSIVVLPDPPKNSESYGHPVIVGAPSRRGLFSVRSGIEPVFVPLSGAVADIDVIQQNLTYFAASAEDRGLFAVDLAIFAGFEASIAVSYSDLARIDVLDRSLLAPEASIAVLAPVLSAAFAQIAMPEAGTACVTSLSPPENVVHWRGDEGILTVQAPADCGWGTSFSAPWLSNLGRGNGIGNGLINYRAAENTGVTLRQATITIDGLNHQVFQSRSGQSQCRLTFQSANISVPAGGATGTIPFTVSDQCAWAAVSNVPWITASGDLIGIGSGSINYQVAPTNLTSSRQGFINFGDGVGVVRFTQEPTTGLSVNAGPDQTVNLPTPAQLSGQATGGSSAISLSWSQIAGPSTVLFSAGSASTTQAIFNREGTYTLRLTATDGTLVAIDDVQVTVGPDPNPPPPDPATIAPAISKTIATNTFASTKFLYTGPNAIQTGVAADTIKAERVGVISGRVIDKLGSPISNVNISIAERPELGQTRTRLDGKFDMVVNAGGELVVKYEKAGFIASQREEKVDWQTYSGFDDVVLLPYDPNVAAIDLSATNIQVASGSQVNDVAGLRRPRLFFKPGTTATMTLPNGTTQLLPVLNVRLTEYTAGERGPEAMPAELPATSEYTFAAEYSVDEAVAVNATSVAFSRPVIQYVENFIGFPVGVSVPTGSYNRKTSEWEPEPSGKVLKILSNTSGVANLDVDGNGIPATDTQYAQLGIDLAERQRLAEIYSTGQTLWRVPLNHFSPWDCNYPPANKPPPDAPAPFVPKPKKVCTEEDGCIEVIQEQTVSETITITQTGYRISYQTGLQKDFKQDQAVIPLVGPSPDPDMIAAGAQMYVAGRVISSAQFTPSAGLTTTLTWDGRDDFGRAVQGSQRVGIVVAHFYPRGYSVGDEFGQTGNGTGQTVGGSGLAQTARTYEVQLGGFDQGRTGLGGWSFDIHHNYNPTTKTLVEGNGKIRSADALVQAVTTSAGLGQDEAGFSGDGGPSTRARLNAPGDVAFAANGTYYIADTMNNRVRRVTPDGVISTFAGNGAECDPMAACGDGGAATAAPLFEPRGVAVAADGTVYISDSGSNRIRRVAPDGTISTLAGTGAACDAMQSCGDGGAADLAQLNKPGKIHLAEDGSIYIADTGSNRVKKISTNGVIRTIAGSGAESCSSDDVPAAQACIDSPTGVALAANGSLFITANAPSRSQTLFLDTAGRVQRIAEGICNGARPAGVRSICNPIGVTIGPDGNPYVASAGEHRIYKYDVDGEWKDFVGSGSNGPNGEGQPDLSANLDEPASATFAPNGDLFIAVTGHNQIRRSASPLPGFSGGTSLIASEDGTEVFQFDAEGQHLRTFSALTGTPKYVFGYDVEGRLITITDGDNNITTVERDGTGNPTGIRSPYGQLTTLTLDANGYLASVTNPAGETNAYTYTEGGLLLTKRDPRNNTNTFTYDETGRLLRNQNPGGGQHNFSRSGNIADFTVTHRSPLNRTSTFRVQNAANGDEMQDIKFEDNTVYRVTTVTDGSTSEFDADGTMGQSILGPDPRWAMQSPLVTLASIATPSGRNLNLTQSRHSTLSDPANPLNLTAQRDVFGMNGRNYQVEYLQSSRTASLTTPMNRSLSYMIDTQERITQFQLGGLNPIVLTYDARGRLGGLSFGSGAAARTSSNTYNSAGLLSSSLDPLGRITSFQYDLAGRMTQKVLEGNRTIAFGYEPSGNLTHVTPPGRPAHSMTYNSRNLVSSYVAPNLGEPSTTTYEYNADTDLTRVTRPDGVEINYTYNGLGQLQTRSIPAGSTTYGYDLVSGQLKHISAPGGVTNSFGYDGFLLVSAAIAGPVAGSVEYTYNNDLNISSVAVNGSNAIDYSYDNDGLLTSIGGMTLVRNTQNDLITGTALQNLTSSASYNGFGEMETFLAKFNATTLYEANYTRDKLGRITRKIETISGSTTTYDYGYDLGDRLSTVTLNAAPQPMVIYGYDSNDNRTSISTGGSAVVASYDVQDRLTSLGATTYAYTANGELTTKSQPGGVTSLGYDSVGNLRSVRLLNGTQIEYIIDGLDRRIGKRVNGDLIQGFLYQDDFQIAAEFDGSGNLMSRFVYATETNVPDFMIRAGQIYRLIRDQVGSVRLVVNVSNGAIVQRIDYDEFGVVLNDTNPGFQPFGFAGGLYDPQTRLTRFGVRDYDAEAGRWTTKDPILFEGGDTNLYSYVLNDPINLKDESGLKAANYSNKERYTKQKIKERNDKCTKELVDKIIEIFKTGRAPVNIPEAAFATGDVLNNTRESLKDSGDRYDQLTKDMKQFEKSPEFKKVEQLNRDAEKLKIEQRKIQKRFFQRQTRKKKIKCCSK